MKNENQIVSRIEITIPANTDFNDDPTSLIESIIKPWPNHTPWKCFRFSSTPSMGAMLLVAVVTCEPL